MPMYFPDLESVKRCAQSMTKNKGDKKYTGIIPQTENELSQARKELGTYFREVWRDEIQAAEVEFGATEENYDNIIGMSLLRTLRNKESEL